MTSRAPSRLFAEPVTKDPVELILNRTWRAALAVTGADGLPPLECAATCSGRSRAQALAAPAAAGRRRPAARS
jgi:hypothetical protein